MSKTSKFNRDHEKWRHSDSSFRRSELSLFDTENPDTNFFDVVDGEATQVAGSRILVYRYLRGDNEDDIYEEERSKPIYQDPIEVFGHYEPRAIEENLGEFGIELTNDQTFKFNKRYLESALREPLKPGDVIKPQFMNAYFEVFEVQEESFEAYGVYHLLCSAKFLRDADTIFPAEYLTDEFDLPEIEEHLDLVYTYGDGYKVMVDVRLPGPPYNWEGLPNKSDIENKFPCILMIHGSGGSRLNNAEVGKLSAKNGIASISVDVRGQGSSAELNPTTSGHEYWNVRELVDLWEALEQTFELFPLHLDSSKIGAMGRDQGGIFSLMLAAYSGKLPPTVVSDRGWWDENTPVPTIMCVSNQTGPHNIVKALVPDSDFGQNTITKGFSPDPVPWDAKGGTGQGLHPDEDYKDIVEGFLSDNDVSGFKDFLETDELFSPIHVDLEDLLKTTDTAIESWIGYDDTWEDANAPISLFGASEGKVRRIIFGLEGSIPFSNTGEDTLATLEKLQIFFHYLQGKSVTVFNQNFVNSWQYDDVSVCSTIFEYLPIGSSSAKVWRAERKGFLPGMTVGIDVKHPGPGWQASAVENHVIEEVRRHTIFFSGTVTENAYNPRDSSITVAQRLEEELFVSGDYEDHPQVEYMLVAGGSDNYSDPAHKFDRVYATHASSHGGYGKDPGNTEGLLIPLYFTSEKTLSNEKPFYDPLEVERVEHAKLETYTMEDYISEVSSGTDMAKSLMVGNDEHGPIFQLSSLSYEMVWSGVVTPLEVSVRKLLENDWYVGNASALVSVSADSPEFHIHVALFEEEEEKGTGIIKDRFINGGFYSVTGHTGSFTDYWIELPPYAFELKKDKKIKVKVENIVLHRPPYVDTMGTGIFRVLPKFSDFKFNMRTTKSYFILPIHQNKPHNLLLDDGII